MRKLMFVGIALTTLGLIVAGCGSDTESVASETAPEKTVTEESAGESTTDASAADDTGVDCRVPSSDAAAMYVGWYLSQELGEGDDSGDANKIPDEIKTDVETLARALVEYSASYSDTYAGEDLGFPPEDLQITPGRTPTDNDAERFYFARDSMGREARTFHRINAWARANCPAG